MTVTPGGATACVRRNDNSRIPFGETHIQRNDRLDPSFSGSPIASVLTGSDDPEPVYDTVGSLNLEIDQSRLDVPAAAGDLEGGESRFEKVEECVACHLAVRTKNCVPSASLVTMVPESATVTVLSGSPVITSTSNAWSAGSTPSPYARPPTGTGRTPHQQSAVYP